MATVMDTLPSATIFFNCTSRAIIDIWINFLVVYSLLKKYFCMNVLCYKESLGGCGDKNLKKESNNFL